MKKVLLILGLVLVIVVAAAGFYIWRGYQKFTAVEAIVVDPQLSIYLGAGNSIVLTSEDGTRALIVDTKMRSAAQTLRNHITAKNITIVNTHAHFDHVGGNSLYPQAKIIAGEYTKEQWNKDSDKSSRYPDIRLGPGEEITMIIGGEPVHIFNMGRAHTMNDMVVYLENRKLLVTGDLVFNHMHPALLPQSGTNVGLWIDALEKLAKKYPVCTLVPGHGALADQKAIAAMKEYFLTIRDAADDKTKQAAAKEKYKDYSGIPGLLSFNHSLKFIRQERKEK